MQVTQTLYLKWTIVKKLNKKMIKRTFLTIKGEIMKGTTEIIEKIEIKKIEDTDSLNKAIEKIKAVKKAIIEIVLMTGRKEIKKLHKIS